MICIHLEKNILIIIKKNINFESEDCLFLRSVLRAVMQRSSRLEKQLSRGCNNGIELRNSSRIFMKDGRNVHSHKIPGFLEKKLDRKNQLENSVFFFEFKNTVPI